jgi:hypothetical protein
VFATLLVLFSAKDFSLISRIPWELGSTTSSSCVVGCAAIRQIPLDDCNWAFVPDNSLALRGKQDGMDNAPVRLSVGIEDVDDRRADLERGLH